MGLKSKNLDLMSKSLQIDLKNIFLANLRPIIFGIGIWIKFQLKNLEIPISIFLGRMGLFLS